MSQSEDVPQSPEDGELQITTSNGGGGGGGGGGGDTFSGASGGGGGGGSSYVEPGAFAQREWRGWKNATGNGIIVFSW